jgi:hypothetical protein
MTDLVAGTPGTFTNLDGVRSKMETGAALRARRPTPPDWAVENFAARGKLTVIWARSGGCKSYLTFAMANGVATGTPVAGLSCQLGRSLVVDVENGSDLATWRAHEADFAATDRMLYADVRGLDFSRAEHRDALAAGIRADGLTFVVIDSLNSTTPGADENSNSDMAPIMLGLQGVARDTGAAIVVLHHVSDKAMASAYRGASAIKDEADFAIALHGAPDRLKLTWQKFRTGRAPEPHHLALVDDDGRVHFEPRQLDPVKTEPKLPDVQAAIISHVGDGEWSVPDAEAIVAEHIDAPVSKSTVERALRKLVEVGSITRVGRGSYLRTVNRQAPICS